MQALSEEKAARMMAALREGRTLRTFGVRAPRLEAYFKLHPDYEREARPLIAGNAKAAHLRKGEGLRPTTHCRAGLHLMTGDNVYLDGTHGRRRCVACRKCSSYQAPLMSAETAAKVAKALERGATLSDIVKGRAIGNGKRDRSTYITSAKIIMRHRRENPDFNRFVLGAIVDNTAVGQLLRRERERNAAKREEVNDYHQIRSMLPTYFPDKDDVVSAIFVDVLTGALKREEVRARVQSYITAHNRMYPTKFAKFGDSPLVSLDEVLFESGTATRGDTVSRGLWD
jgi:hypothetical protein